MLKLTTTRETAAGPVREEFYPVRADRSLFPIKAHLGLIALFWEQGKYEFITVRCWRCWRVLDPEREKMGKVYMLEAEEPLWTCEQCLGKTRDEMLADEQLMAERLAAMAICQEGAD